MSKSGAGASQPLDEVMLAMDVVDTLRRRERIVEKELGDTERRAGLKQRLKEIYSSQGIEVPDRILDEGVQALTENRFVFEPPESGLAVSLARIYVTRKRWGKWLFRAVAAIVVISVLNYFFVVRPTAAIGENLTAVHSTIGGMTTDEASRKSADDLYLAGTAAIDQGNTQEARNALSALESMSISLGQSYTLKIVNESGANTAIWRIPDVNEATRNYYVIVDAIGAADQKVEVSVLNEETGKRETVSRWGIRISAETFDKIADDKLDDGILQNSVFGSKARGKLEPVYEFPTTGGAITRW